MKKIFTYFAIIALGLTGLASCGDIDYVYPDPADIPQYMIKVPIISATATATNGYSMKGTITTLNEEGTEYNIDFKFDANGIDLTQISVELEYCSRTIHKDNALDGPTVLDLRGKPYVMTVNDVKKDVQYTITASIIPCQEPILSASIQCGDAREVAEVDNVNHTVTFYITNANIDKTNADVTINYNERASLGEGAFTTKKGMDLTDPYKFIVNDAVNDLEYTMTAKYMNVPIMIPYGQAHVFRVTGDANIITDNSASADHMFDGIYHKYYGGQGAEGVKHAHVYWYNTNPDTEHGNFILFDVGEAVTMAQAAVHVYKNYNDQDCMVYEIYAYKTSTVNPPSSFNPGTSDWVKIIEGDDSAVWDEAQVVNNDRSLVGTDQDPLTKTYTHGTISGISVPSARYYAFKGVKNAYELQPTYYSKQLGWNPTNRWNMFTFMELELWQYKKD